MSLKNVADLVTEMGEETYNFWVFLGNRLLHGEKNYGGFKFGEYNLDQMELEEWADGFIYRMGREYLKKLQASGELLIDE